MGMFDYISVSDNLPFNDEMKELGIDKNNLVFQTKCLDCSMDNYIIQSNKLFIQKYKSENWVEGNKNSKNIFDQLGHIEREGPYYEEVNFHGEIYFYEFLSSVKDKWDCWIEYKAVFTQNNLISISLFKFTKEDNTERLQREKEWQKKIQQEQSLWYNKYFLNTKTYRWFSRKVLYRSCQYIGNFFIKISYKL
jgi:hypothetical protein